MGLTKSKIVKIISYLLLLVVYMAGSFTEVYNIGLFAVIGVFLYNIIENLIRKERSMFYILFHAFIFLFILDRPIISLLRGDVWWYFKSNTVFVTLFILLLSMMCLNFGFYWKGRTEKEKKTAVGSMIEKINLLINNKVRRTLFVGTLITLIASLYKEGVTFLQSYGNYADRYLGLSVKVPFYISILAGMAVYFVIGYLATMPRKWCSIVVLGIYLVTGIPGLVSGGRNAFMIKALFCFLYFLFRECYEKNGKWIGKKEIIAVVLLIPIAIIGLGIMNYTRAGVGVEKTSMFAIAEDFFYKQGTSFDTLCQTVEYRNVLRDDNYVNYTFGELYDFVFYNGISNKILGTIDFGEGNNIYSGTVSNNLAHRVSYIVLGNSYLTGHGRGTTYFSEIYLDLGYLGLIIFNLLIGLFISKMSELFQKGIVQRILVLNCVLYFYMIPRLSFFSIFNYTINYYFWMFVVLLLIFIFVFRKKGTEKL